jgi:hypothetical protein
MAVSFRVISNDAFHFKNRPFRRAGIGAERFRGHLKLTRYAWLKEEILSYSLKGVDYTETPLGPRKSFNLMG